MGTAHLIPLGLIISLTRQRGGLFCTPAAQTVDYHMETPAAAVTDASVEGWNEWAVRTQRAQVLKKRSLIRSG